MVVMEERWGTLLQAGTAGVRGRGVVAAQVPSCPYQASPAVCLTCPPLHPPRLPVVESHVDNFLHDHMAAEVVTR